MDNRVTAIDREALERLYAANSLDPDAFLKHSVVVDRLTQLKLAFDLSPKPGLALEFGVFKGASLRALAFHDKAARFTGFDSFSGLPEDWHRSPDSTYEAGHFALKDVPLMPANVELVEGFFEDTLGDWLVANPGKVGFLHIDGDLYSSAKFVLNMLSDRIIDGTVVVFDELGDWKDEGVYPYWRDGEWRALKEWLADTGFVFRILSRGPRFEAAIQVFKGPVKPLRPADVLAFATRLWELGAQEQAVGLLSGAVRAERSWVTGHYRLAQWQTKMRRAEEALATIDLIWEGAQRSPDHPHSVDLIRLRADNRLKLNQLSEAKADIKAFLAKRPKHATGMGLSAAIAAKRCDHKAAANAWTKAYHLSGLETYRDKAEVERILAEIRPEFDNMRSGLLIQHLVEQSDVQTVLDVGSGAGEQAIVLRRHGRRVTEVDYGEGHYSQANENETVIRGDFMHIALEEQFDCVLASHVLEHQLNVNAFLKKMHSHVREDGFIALSVPPLKHQIVGGHVTLWNAGLVLYNLVLAGFDCRKPWIRQYGYNISVAVRKRSIEPAGLVYDKGDIDRIAPYLPEGFTEGFDGDIRRFG